MPICKLCEREVANTTQHHLIPLEKGGKGSIKVDLCQPCHRTLHHTFTNLELAKKYNTIPLLQNAPQLERYLSWIRKRKIEHLNF
jgi:5-methylcytosine-specific restriction enzyme A